MMGDWEVDSQKRGREENLCAPLYDINWREKLGIYKTVVHHHQREERKWKLPLIAPINSLS
jgi:hypothetical protein